MPARRSNLNERRNITVDQIVAAALARADKEGWQSIRIHHVADDLDVPLSAVSDLFQDQDAITNAWFKRPLEALLAPMDKAFRGLPPKERLFLVIMRWFDAMADHRPVAVDMIRAKIYIGHPHHWVPLIFNLSRLVQWIREAALLDAEGRQRQIEEIGLTVLILTTLGIWATDDSDNQKNTQRFLRRRLEGADRIMARLVRRT